MGIFDALNTSVAGMQAQSYALQNISGNIANAQTTAYKGIGTSFVDLIPDASTTQKQVAGSVTAYAHATITTQGTISSTAVSTDMAINGDGFFSVQKSNGTVDNKPVFTGVTNYTRRGDFQLDANGNLVNGAGYYLMGVPVDSATGNPLGNVPQVLQFSSDFIPAQPTSVINYAANLPSTPTTNAATSATPGTITALGGLNPSDFSPGFNPRIVGTAAPPYIDTPVTGAAASAKDSTAVTTATVLSGLAGTDSISTNFAVGDSISVNGTSITFVAGVPGANELNITDSVGDLLAAIDAITGAPASTVSGTGAITLHSGTTADLSITGGTANATAALAALGLTDPVTATRGGGGTPGAGVVAANDVTTFLNQSISGGAVTAYDSTGTPVNLQLRWAKVDSAALGGTHSNTWNLFYQADPNATGTETAWVNAGTDFVFNGVGSLTSPASPSITIPNVSVAGQNLGNLQFTTTTTGLTQYASTGGTATINAVSQNGYAAGQLQSVSVNNNGIVVGTFSNGQNLKLAAVSLVHFNGTNYLKALDGAAYAVTDESGPAILGASGTISGSSLEGSNTDIAQEFTKLIITQQAYSANTKVITTANSMVQDLLSVLR